MTDPMTEGAKTDPAEEARYQEMAAQAFPALAAAFDKARDTEEYRKEREEIRKGEGAETGTPREWKLIIDMESGMVSDYFGPDMELGDRPTNEILVREVLDHDPLTEALKVAGEALQSVKEAWENPEMGWVATEKVELALAALERIRNQSKS